MRERKKENEAQQFLDEFTIKQHYTDYIVKVLRNVRNTSE